ncbi:MAG: cobalamin B12-binding domain-containing protein [Phycisphaeraceae bacterium]|nr:MAG: cobalamin B12-binding domain-containing protein [Phycisphaeraceae bacterium]
MTEPGDGHHEFIGELLRSQATPIAQDATAHLLALRPSIAPRPGTGPAPEWRDAVESRVRDLAEAVALDAPGLLADQVVWARLAFLARGISPDPLRDTLDAIARALPAYLPPDDLPLAVGFLDHARRCFDEPNTEPPPFLSVNATLGRLAANYLLAILEGDRARACDLVVDAAAGKGQPAVHPADLYEHVFTPVLREVGRMWHAGEVNVAEEHFASATTGTAMARVAALAPKAPRDGRVVLAASVAGNHHDLGVRMVADQFEWAGWRAIYLGPNLPAEDLVLAVMDFKVDLLALSVALPQQVRHAAQTVETLRAASKDRLKVIIGGNAFSRDPSLASRVGADAHAASPRDAVALADRLVPRR